MTAAAVGRGVGSRGGNGLKKCFERLRFMCCVGCGREGVGSDTKSTKTSVTGLYSPVEPIFLGSVPRNISQ
jgi:hypothetical protein